MPAKNTEKKLDSIKELQKSISPILVINNHSLKPYIELFEYEPENIYQKPLGTLVGFFEIKEYSEQSAYVVNFLTSVLKKEYYANSRRSVTESFDSAMHKVNLALSEVAKHGNVEWIGKLHACICVVEKNSIHFTVAGSAKIFLNRKQALTDISEGLSSDESEPHPLKTFVNVSSGRLEKGDKLIITCEDIFHILKISDLKKSIDRLNKQQFVQFLKTALSNELEMIANIVIDFEETKKNPAPKTLFENQISPTEETINFFSQQAFPKEDSLKKTEQIAAQVEESSNQEDYTDKKTGHIYIQGDELPTETSQMTHYLEMAGEKFSDLWHFSKNAFRRNFELTQKRLAKTIQQAKANAELRKQQAEQEKQLADQQLEILQQQQIEAEEIQKAEAEPTTAIIEKITPVTPKRKLAPIINLKEITTPEENTKIETLLKPEKEDSTIQTTQVQNFDQTEKIAQFSEKFKNVSEKVVQLTISSAKKLAKLKKPSQEFLQATLKKISHEKTVLGKSAIIPHLSKLKKLYQKFTFKQKTNIFLALVAIFVIPFFIAKWLNRPKPATITDLPKVEITQTEKLSNEKNIKLNSASQQLLSNSQLSGILLADGNMIAWTKSSLLVWKDQVQNEYALPTNAGNIATCTYMADLSMVLILTDQNKIFSFTTSNAKFAENNITLSSASPTKLIGTYLTYLYFLDQTSNQIVRYPRAEGGFGEKINWLKETASFGGVSDMTIDDSIYLIQSNQVVKFFKGKKESLILENSNTPIQFDKIFTTIDLKSLYALDTQNSRLVQYDKVAGTITAQFYSEALKTGTSLAVDEKNKTAYVVTSSGLVSVAIQ